MFSERFDSLMNIAEISNSQLGRDISMNPSYIGRLRSGARPLPRKHEYLTAMCQYLAGHIKKDYQLSSLQKLTGISSADLSSPESTALYLELWLLEEKQDSLSAAGRLVSSFARLTLEQSALSAVPQTAELPRRFSAYYFGNAGKRKAVEQFFMMILQEKKPQTLLLFSDENMEWLYEDPAFAARWTELFTRVVMKGNRVKIVHTVSRDMNEMLEAVTKWIPIYMSGMIEPYFYPRLRDGVFQRTLFIAPDTAAVVSSSVQQNTSGMLNLFLTDKAAVSALKEEYLHYFALCRPLMHIYTERDVPAFRKAAESLLAAEENAYLRSCAPPLFSMPEKLVLELAKQPGNDSLIPQWKRSISIFRKNIKKCRLTVVLPYPDIFTPVPDGHSLTEELFSGLSFSYTREQYAMHTDRLRQLEKQYGNLKICFSGEPADSMLIYAKENTGVIMARLSTPETAFLITDRNLISAFMDYLENTY